MDKRFIKYMYSEPQKGEWYMSGLRILEAKENMTTKHFIMIEVPNIDDI